MRWRWSGLANWVAAGLVLAACGTAFLLFGKEPESRGARVLSDKAIRIGYAMEVPYAYRDADGRVTGESPEVARAVLGALGVRDIDWVATDFGALIPGLLAGRFDMIAAGMFVNPERERLVDFSHPTACVDSALLVRSGNPRGLRVMADLARDEAARLAVVSGAVEFEQARAAGIAFERIQAFASFELAVEAVRRGVADALALSGPTVQIAADRHADLERAMAPEGGEALAGCAAFAFRPGDRPLREAVDAQLAVFFGSEAHLSLVRPFGFRAENLRTPARLPTPGEASAMRGKQ